VGDAQCPPAQTQSKLTTGGTWWRVQRKAHTIVLWGRPIDPQGGQQIITMIASHCVFTVYYYQGIIIVCCV
jgi:hypothetical protein